MRVLIIDDSTLFRKIISDAISGDPEIEVVGRSRDGVVGFQKLKELNPDVVTLDMEMPEMCGLEVLDAINREKIDVAVIMISAHTRSGGEKTLQALQKGAFDFVTKPDLGSVDENTKFLRETLIQKIKIGSTHKRRPRQTAIGGTTTIARPQVAVKTPSSRVAESRIIGLPPEILAIGISTGGPEALRKMLPKIPINFKVPILIVQHMPDIFTKSLADMLNNICPLNVKEAADGDIIEAGTVYIARGGRQMKLMKEGKNKVLRLTDDPPESSCKPSVNYLFRSLANHFPGKTAAVIMTGMGNDGALGLKLLRRHGCRTIAQDEASSTVFGMPKVAIEANLIDTIVSLDDMSKSLISAVN